MKLYIKQKLFSLTSNFSVKDENNEDKYFVKGEFFSLRGKLHILNQNGEEIGLIYAKLFTLFPRFFLEINGQEVAQIVKEFSFFKPKYRLENTTLRVEGDLWSHNYSLFDSDKLIMTIMKEWFAFSDTYALEIFDPSYELISLGIVLAIDTANAQQAAANVPN